MFKLNDYKSISQREEKTTKFWKENNTFQKSIDQRSDDNRYSFLDGPPFVTGLPHYAQLLPRIAKDVIPRYQTMKGKRVRRVWGWDCHGLPIEEIVERNLGLKNRRDIEKFGINKFITKCAAFVNSTTTEWNWYMDKIGSWCDMENAYRTMDKDYMETVIWVFKQMYDKGLVYEGAKTLLYCTRCGTPVSKFEITMDDSYTDVEDPTITVEFPVTSKGKFEGSRILAWTTTPWTMPGHRALVVDPQEVYVEFTEEGSDNKYIMARKLLGSVAKSKDPKILREFEGKELLGLDYEPPYAYIPPNENDFKIYEYDGMVNMDDGTGIVHSAPGFGEIDTDMGHHYGLTIMYTVDDEGRLIDEVTDFAGVYVKDADSLIIKDLEKKNVLYDQGKITHRYPFCYRCHTPLIQKSVKSWFVDVQSLKDNLVKQNKNINWVPEMFKVGRFQYTIESAPDWCISRTRYWATAMPVWKCDSCEEQEVFGSISELEERSGETVKGLHRNDVDHIEFPCKKCNGKMKRIAEVLDCWMESGSMSMAQVHYPFENEDLFKKTFPADYIVEYVAQIRAWFYYMHVVSNAVLGKNSFKNVVVTGVMAGDDGRKMSKSFGNFPDPKDTLDKYGGDAIRLYLMSSPIMAGMDMNFNEKDLKENVQKMLNPLWNAVKYLVIYANKAKWKPKDGLTEPKIKHLMDRWMIARLKTFHEEFESNLEKYHVSDACRSVIPFLEDVSTWYIRRSRTRFVEGDPDALATLYYVLMQTSFIVAPVTPFIAEEIYQSLYVGHDKNALESIHLDLYPEKVKPSRDEYEELTQMELVRNLSSAGLSVREAEGIKLRQPLPAVEARLYGRHDLKEEYRSILGEELNVQDVQFVKKLSSGKNWIAAEETKQYALSLNTEIDDKLAAEGLVREVVRQIQGERKKVGLKMGEETNVTVCGSKKDLDILKERENEIRRTVSAGEFVLSSKDKAEKSTKKHVSVTI